MLRKHARRFVSRETVDAEGTALGALYVRYAGVLADGLRAVYGAGPPEPEDIVQRAFERLAAHADLDSIRDVEGYLWITARNIVISDKRAEQVRARNANEVATRFFGERSEAFDPQRVFIAIESVDVVVKTLAEMPARRRDIFMLNRVHGLSIKEAGSRCGVSQTAAHRHIGLAMAQIASALEQASLQRDMEADG